MDKLLTDEQKQKVLEKWTSDPDNPPSLLELIKAAYPDEKFDGRTKEGKLVKEYLIQQNIQTKNSHNYNPKKVITLTDEQKEYIENNAITMRAYEIARVLFDDNTITNLHLEARAISKHIETLDARTTYENPVEVPQEEYKPPKMQSHAIVRVNKYVLGGVDKDNLTPQNKKNISSLIGYMHTYRFLHQINLFDNQTERDLYESSFVRYTHDKSDLTEEEVDQFIILSHEVVIASNIQRRVERLQRLLDDAAEDTEGRRIAMALVEAIGKAQVEYNQSVLRQQKLLHDLKEKRSDRLKSQIKENASILNLIELWKDEESRGRMIKIAELRKESVKKEISRLSSMDEIKARIMGLNEDEALNG